MQNYPIARDLVLVGGGHSHVIVLRMLAMKPVPGLQVTLVSPDVRSAYSGMLPGLVAGHYTEDDIHIELGALCRFAGARFIAGSVTAIDTADQYVCIAGRPRLGYDVVSIDTGIAPDLSAIAGAREGIAVKPINRFLAQWTAFRARVQTGDVSSVAFVGAGAGGVELCLAARHALRRAGHGLAFHLVSDKTTLLADYPARVQARFMSQLTRHQVELHTQFRVTRYENSELVSDSGTRLRADEVFFVTRAGAPEWLRATSLELDEHGFILVRPTLQAMHHDNVFAAGDIAHVREHPRPKAGVYAVRQGRPLYRNILRVLHGKRARPFRPQAQFLSLISTGPRHAVASKRGFSAEGHWVWQWKNRIDKRFMRRFNRLPAMRHEAFTGLLKDFDAQMHCGGCGAKLSADILREVLAESGIAPAGLDDAAVARVPEGRLLLSSVDAFRAFIDDPYEFARVAVNHALGDIYAMGGEPVSALALITLPYATPAKAKQLLQMLLAGTLAQLALEDVELAGGHTTEGIELSLGFAVNGMVDAGRVLAKSGMQPGDRLILTKAVGTGALFAADMQARAKGKWTRRALDEMLVSSRAAAAILRGSGTHALTDVTGFGLAGHLSEMLVAGNCSARLMLDALPVLPGALDVIGAGITSTLHEGNRRSVPGVAFSAHKKFELLFDPQTAGGLLASVAAEEAAPVLAQLHAAGYADAAIIGEVTPGDEQRIQLD